VGGVRNGGDRARGDHLHQGCSRIITSLSHAIHLKRSASAAWPITRRQPTLLRAAHYSSSFLFVITNGMDCRLPDVLEREAAQGKTEPLHKQ